MIKKTILALFASFFLASALFGQCADEEEFLCAEELQESGFDLFWDKVYLGEAFGHLDCEGELIDIAYCDIAALLCDKIDDEQMAYICDCQDGQGWVEICCLERYCPVFDGGIFSLFLSTPPHERDTHFVDLNPKPTIDLEGCLPPEPVAGYINFTNVARVQGSQNVRYALELDGAANVYDWVLEGRGTYDTRRRYAMTYNNLRLTKDFLPNCTRITVGEVQSFQAKMLNSQRIQGVQYSTSPVLHRDRVTQPISEFEFFLERDSRVEVWVNDKQKNVLHLQAGPQDVRNFPLTTGFNSIRLKITDDLGRIEYRTFDAIRAPCLLPKDEQEFTFSAGVKGRGDRWSDDGVIAGNWRRGLSSELTGIWRFSLDERYQGMTMGAAFGTRYFTTTLEISGTHSPWGQGVAAEWVVERPSPTLFLSSRISYWKRDYLTNDEDRETVRPKSKYQLTASSHLPGCWGYIQAISYRENRWRGGPASRQELSWIATLWRNWSVKLTAEYSRYKDPKGNFYAMIAYSTSDTPAFTRRHSVEATKHSRTLRNTFGGYYGGDMIRWTAEHQRSWKSDKDPYDNVSLSTRFDAGPVLFNYVGWWDRIQENPDVSHIFRLGASLACAGGQWAIGHPIYHSFVLVKCGDELRDIPMRVIASRREVELKNHAVVISDLPAYRKSEIRAIPIDDLVEVEMSTYKLAPHYRSGSLLTIKFAEGQQGFWSCKGVLFDQKGNPVSHRAISFLSEGDSVPSFTDQEGFFWTSGLAQGTAYTIEVAGDEALHYEITTGKGIGDTEQDLGMLIPIKEGG